MGDKIRLLLVEDEQTLAGIIADTLSEKGFEVTVAHDGEAGLRAFRGSRPDVVVSDVMMPCMDGFTFVGRLRREAPGVPVLFLSARSAAEDVVQGFETGGNDYLRKPFAMSELIVRVRALAGRAGVGKARTERVFELGRMRFDAERQRLSCDGVVTELSARESEVLQYLCRECRRDRADENPAGEYLGRRFVFQCPQPACLHHPPAPPPCCRPVDPVGERAGSGV